MKVKVTQAHNMSKGALCGVRVVVYLLACLCVLEFVLRNYSFVLPLDFLTYCVQLLDFSVPLDLKMYCLHTKHRCTTVQGPV